ncbi:hypothetical protein JCM24511_01853 [Saitozyma sp. JCM 24511]|nr:hypothetical protein JCM24511_01853 [Saitozyma sp. JCM 24511]
MANLLSGVFHTVEGLVQSVLAVIQSIFNIIFSVFHGAFTVVWDLIESLAKLVGASAHFVISNIVILGLIAVVFVIYNDRSKRGSVKAPGSRKKVQ